MSGPQITARCVECGQGLPWPIRAENLRYGHPICTECASVPASSRSREGGLKAPVEGDRPIRGVRE